MKDILEEIISRIQEKGDERNRSHTGKTGGSMSITAPAKMAREIEKQLGVDGSSIKKMARNLVATMILQYNPNLSSRELKTLVDHMVPDREKKKVPPEILREMIAHFTSYARGTMKPEDAENLPEKWTEKYWSFFPDKINYLIILYIREEMDESLFWRSVNMVLEKDYP